MLPQKFIDRKNETIFLRKVYAKNSIQIVVIYGRRRVGKSELIKNFILDKKSCYILCTNDSMNENLKSFKERIGQLTGKEYFKDLALNDFYELFKHFIKEFGDRKAIIAIDEFPFLLDLNKGILSTFQKIIDELLNKSKIMIILSGSSLSMMEKDVLGYRTPLYGRHLNIWKLAPFKFSVISGMFNDLNTALNAYFIFGNIPYYLNFFKQDYPVEKNVKENILTKGMGLYDEPLILLREEFRESRIYRLILKSISLGNKSIGKLCSDTGMDKSNISKYLSTLEETGFIKHILPLGKKRKGIYEIIDPFFDFWFRFVYPNKDDLELGNLEKVLDKFKIQKNIFFGRRFEFLIEELIRTECFPELKEFHSVHKWWHKDKEIDIVALNEDKKEILFCECKWQDKVDAIKVLGELKEKAEYVQWNNNKRKEHYAIFAKSFKKKIKGKKTTLIDLKDMTRLLKPRTQHA